MKYSICKSPIFLCCTICFLIVGCNRKKSTTDAGAISFDVPAVQPVVPIINEASGIADSKINPGYAWAEEDSGNPPQLYLLNHNGKVLKTIYIKGATNVDWEDIALAPGPDAAKSYLYIAEIGDNDGVHATSAFYRFEEPLASTDSVRIFDKVTFAYPDGPRDAEAFVVEEATKDIYIISKRDSKSRLYKISWPYSIITLNTAVFIQELPYNGVVSAALSIDGKGMIVKTYPQLFYYSRLPGETIAQTLKKDYTSLSYQLEPQGEAVGFAQDNSGFYTISEKGNSDAQVLYFYKKK
ncbi:MAG: hypothetical protein ABJB86_25100 [Bacteroidota bacterium]